MMRSQQHNDNANKEVNKKEKRMRKKSGRQNLLVITPGLNFEVLSQDSSSPSVFLYVNEVGIITQEQYMCMIFAYITYSDDRGQIGRVHLQCKNWDKTTRRIRNDSPYT